MIWLRSFIYLIGQIISAVVILTAILLTFPFPRPVTDRVIRTWAQFNIWTLHKICRVNHRVRGMENLPEEATVVISNHQSAWETLCFQLLFPSVSFVLKRQLLWIPFFGWGLAAYKPIAIDRSRKVRALDQLIHQGQERLSEGRWLIIYPEGTRMEPGSPGPFMAGGAMISSRSGAPALPIAHNAGLFWPKNSFLKYPGTIDLVIGKPIWPTDKKARQINQESENWIRSQLSELPDSR